MPRKQMLSLPIILPESSNKKNTISQYFSTASCIVCGQHTTSGLCDDCCNLSQQTVTFLEDKVRIWERSFFETTTVSTQLHFI